MSRLIELRYDKSFGMLRRGTANGSRPANVVLFEEPLGPNVIQPVAMDKSLDRWTQASSFLG